LAQAKQLLTTGDFSPVISDYSRELHDKLMEIKLMSNADITFSFVENHSNSITGLIQDMHILFESLDDSVKNAIPKIEIIEQKLFSIYNV
jgi:transcriptional accessory protein Tex/SPT6